jgi:hypothetical protein
MSLIVACIQAGWLPKDFNNLLPAITLFSAGSSREGILPAGQ